jgi:protein-disulfide isomerase
LATNTSGVFIHSPRSASLTLPELAFQVSATQVFEFIHQRRIRSCPLIVFRRALASLSLAVFAVLAAYPLIGVAMAQETIAALVARPGLLPEIALGSAKAPVTIVEYASMSCPHCAAFGENVFPMLRSKYIDTGKVRFVFREFPLDIKAAAASVLARCIGKDDPEKFFGAIQLLFQQQEALMAQTLDTMNRIGAYSGMNEQAVEACVKDQALLDKLKADQQFAFDSLQVTATPTFFVNGERLNGTMSFEEFEARIKPLLKNK